MTKKLARKKLTPGSWNKKIAKTRDVENWKRRVIEGKNESPMHPTVLKTTRVTQGISQEVFAKKVELSVTTYGDIERAKRPVRSELAERIAKELNQPARNVFTQYRKTTKLLALKA